MYFLQLLGHYLHWYDISGLIFFLGHHFHFILHI